MPACISKALKYVTFYLTGLAERVREEGLKVVCVPTSFQARQLIVNNNLQISDLEITPEVKGN